MKYLLLIYDEEKNFEKMTEAEMGKMVSDYGQFTQGIQASGPPMRSGGWNKNLVVKAFGERQEE